MRSVDSVYSHCLISKLYCYVVLLLLSLYSYGRKLLVAFPVSKWSKYSTIYYRCKSSCSPVDLPVILSCNCIKSLPLTYLYYHKSLHVTMKVCVFIFSSLFHIFIFTCAIRCNCLAVKFIRFILLVCDTMLFDLSLTAFNCY